MLVLSRTLDGVIIGDLRPLIVAMKKAAESGYLDEYLSHVNPLIEIKIVDIRVGDSEHSTKVRLGIEADKVIPIHRLEVFQKIESQGSVS